VLGGTLDPHAAFLILRGLKTYFVRYRAQCASALGIATVLAAHPAVERIHYPGLPGHPQHALAARQMQEFGSIVSFDLRGGAETARRFADGLKLFALAASVGSTESLVMTAQTLGRGELDAGQQRMAAITEGTIRLSIGLEDPEDLLADLNHALEAALA
jgi:cystathionine beta-lyase/cystathionine gamma-synthase